MKLSQDRDNFGSGLSSGYQRGRAGTLAETDIQSKIVTSEQQYTMPEKCISPNIY